MTGPDDPNTNQSSSIYIMVIGVLLLALVATGWSLNQVVADAESPPASPVTTAAAPAPPPPAIQVIDLESKLEERTRAITDALDTSVTYLNNRFGSVRAELVSYRQIRPLHFHRAAHEAGILVQGNATMTASPAGQQPMSPTKLYITPPYSGHAWENPSSDEMAIILFFSTPPNHRPVDDDFFVTPKDPRLRLGNGSTSYDFKDALEQLGKAGGAASRESLPLLNDKLSSLLVGTTAELTAPRAGTLVYVVQGSGNLSADGTDHAIKSGNMVFVRPETMLTVAANEGSPLGLLLFEPSNDGASDILLKEKKLYSQLNEELVIRDFFQDRREGVFLDVGAGNYKRDSTTFFLEEQLGWTGVSVDALAELGPDYKKHRPRTKFMNFLITDKATGLHKFYRANNYLEVSSANKKVASEQADYYEGDGAVTELEVQSITLTELLQLTKTESIDFMSMDIEEWEPAALRGFDIDTYKPELVCIEAHRTVQDEILAYFHDHGYERLDQYIPYDRFNWYFTPKVKAD